MFLRRREYIIAEAWKGERITAYRGNLGEDSKEQKNLYGREECREKCRKFEKIINNHVEMLEEERKRRMTWLRKEKIKKAMRRMRG